MEKIEFDEKEWHLEQELDKKTGEMKIIITRVRGDYMDVIQPNGDICAVPQGTPIDMACGPTVRVSMENYTKFQEGLNDKAN